MSKRCKDEARAGAAPMLIFFPYIFMGF